MMEYVKKHRPKVVYISYGETDDFAHDGRYDHYLNSAHQTDQWIADIWSFIESDPYYSGKTSLLITTDHGRGNNPMSEWKSHGTIYKGSNAIWIAALGPDIAARGMVETNEQLLQSQVAATLAAILGLDYKPSTFEAGTSIKSIVD
jgi:bisphosphoglycerate-independent phosphoglycerate mutase (AlkP superfamily)